MKKFIYILLLLISVNISFSSNFEVKPIIIDYYGVVSEGNLTIAYGSDGYINYSIDDDNTWYLKKVFDKGIISSVIIDDNSNKDFIISFYNFDNI